jgi:heme A synthase
VSDDTQSRVRELADNAWLLLISRAVAPLAGVVVIALAGWAYRTDRAVLENTASARAALELSLENKNRLDQQASWGVDIAVVRTQLEAVRDGISRLERRQEARDGRP